MMYPFTAKVFDSIAIYCFTADIAIIDNIAN